MNAPYNQINKIYCAIMLNKKMKIYRSLRLATNQENVKEINFMKSEISFFFFFFSTFLKEFIYIGILYLDLTHDES